MRLLFAVAALLLLASPPHAHAEPAPTWQDHAAREAATPLQPAPRPTPESVGENPVSPASLISGSTRTIFSLIAVIGAILVLFAGTRWLARRHGSLLAAAGPGGRAPSGIISILGRYPVSRGQTLMLLRVERRVLLVSQNIGGRGSAPSMQTIASFDDPRDVASIVTKAADSDAESNTARFQQLLGSLTQDEAVPQSQRTATRPVSTQVEPAGVSSAAEDAVRLMRQRLARMSAEGGER